MRIFLTFGRIALANVFGLWCAAGYVGGAEVLWTLDATQSNLKVVVDVFINGEYSTSFAPQGPGADIATYSGTLKSQIDSSTIEITTANMVAAITGDWDPLPNLSAGKAPANYGHILNLQTLGSVFTTIRDASAVLTSSPIPLAGGPSALTFDFDGNDINLDYTIQTATRSTGALAGILGSLGGGGTASSLLAAATGSLDKSPGQWTLTIPMYASIDSLTINGTPLGDVAIRYQLIGHVVATAVPEPSTLTLFGVAIAALALLSSQQHQTRATRRPPPCRQARNPPQNYCAASRNQLEY